MRYVLALALLTVSATSIFAQLNTLEKADSKPITDCFPKTVIIVPSEKIDPLIIVKPSEKFDSKMLIEILCPAEFLINKTEENLFPPIDSDTSKKPKPKVKLNL